MKKNSLIILLLASIFILTACKVDDKVEIDKKTYKLEQEGKIPKLDRSASLIGKLTKNGIREDVEKWIIKKYPNQISEAKQKAKIFQKILTLDITDENAINNLDKENLRARACIYLKYDDSNLMKENPTQENPVALSTELEKITFNTEQRLKIYIKYNNAMNGRSFKSYGSYKGVPCDE